MKPQSTSSTASSIRCAHRDSSGRQCRSLTSSTDPGLCPHHCAQLEESQAVDRYLDLTIKFEGFQTAQGINHSLGNLYKLLAMKRISPRRAAVLSYISSLLLRTLPQIDADNAAGIKFKPPTLDVATPAPANPVSADPAATNSTPSPVLDADPVTATNWDHSIPEPDPNRKPS
jgi:hypothetical protein